MNDVGYFVCHLRFNIASYMRITHRPPRRVKIVHTAGTRPALTTDTSGPRRATDNRADEGGRSDGQANGLPAGTARLVQWRRRSCKGRVRLSAGRERRMTRHLKVELHSCGLRPGKKCTTDSSILNLRRPKICGDGEYGNQDL